MKLQSYSNCNVTVVLGTWWLVAVLLLYVCDTDSVASTNSATIYPWEIRALKLHVGKWGMTYPSMCLLSHQFHPPPVYAFVELYHPPPVLQFGFSPRVPSSLNNTSYRQERGFSCFHNMLRLVLCMCNGVFCTRLKAGLWFLQLVRREHSWNTTVLHSLWPWCAQKCFMRAARKCDTERERMNLISL